MGAMKTALDLTLFSLRKMGPMVSRVWLITKEQISSTKAKPLVCNFIVRKMESALDTLHEKLLTTCIEYRARLLPKELEELEKQVEQLKKEINDTKKAISKNLRPVVATAWQYAKVEMVPPMTTQMFQGSLGKSIENTVGGATDKFISGIEQKLKDIEAQRIRVIKQKEAAIKAAADKAKAEALKKVEEEKRLEAAKAAAAAKQAKAKEAATQPAKKKDSPKTETKSKVKADTKKKQKRVPPKTKKKAKTTRRKVKKGSPPKAKK